VSNELPSPPDPPGKTPAPPAESPHARASHFAFIAALHHFTPQALVTRLLVLSNVFIFIWMGLHGVDWFEPKPEQLLHWGAGFAPLTLAGEWWRIPFSLFLHFGLLHLAFNMWVLWDIGHLVERLLGHAGFFLLYLIAGLAGGLCSMQFHFDSITAGASGAIFGVFGCFLAYLLRMRHSIPEGMRRKFMRSCLFFIGINLAIGMSVPFIDLSAHLGGLVSGFFLGLMLAHPLTPSAVAQRWRRNLLLLLAVPLLAGGFLGVRLLNHDVSPVEVLLREGLTQQALQLIEQRIQTSPQDSENYYFRAIYLANERQWDAALKDVDQALAKGMRSVQVLALQAECLNAKGNHPAALEALQQAHQLEPDDPSVLNSTGFECLSLGRAEAAEQAWRRAAELTELPEEKAGYLENIGIILANQGAWEPLLRHTRDVEQMDPDLVWNLILRQIAADKTSNTLLVSGISKRLRQLAVEQPERFAELKYLNRLLAEPLRPYLGPAAREVPPTQAPPAAKDPRGGEPAAERPPAP
jgi:rhomboid protease GluP